MKKISEQFKQDVNSLVAEIEAKTTGEIVPVVLERSDSYPSAHFRWAVILSIIFPVCLYFAPIPLHDPIWFLAAQAIGVALGLLIAFSSKAKRLMLTRGQLNEEVHQRALQAFYEHGVGNTKDRDGVLIFISLLEHRALILADIGIAAKVANDQWDAILKEGLINLKRNNLNEALLGLIRGTGDKLTQHFPRNTQESEDNQVSELDDGLRTQ